MTTLVRKPKFKMPKATKLKSAKIKVKTGVVASPREMERSAGSFGKGAKGRLDRWARGKV
jgi:hypothetical protein